ncbi:hypothetical protein ONS96_011622 [Cadophora gregata f. sp. sojae]|nr:hypothetical protein ONS96_011622 [Cadophora gregata f. sp. sojae]
MESLFSVCHGLAVDWIRVLISAEICYNARERLSFDIVGDLSSPSPTDAILDRNPMPIGFRYSFRREKAIYIFRNSSQTTEHAIRGFCELIQQREETVHPFALHLVILQDSIGPREEIMTFDLKSLLLIEDSLLKGSLMAMQSLDEFRQQTQELHELSRSMIIIEHYNDRDISNLRNLLRDMERLAKEGNRLGGEYEVDFDSHERMNDGLLCLLDFCIDRARRLSNRKQRVQNLIGLVGFLSFSSMRTST